MSNHDRQVMQVLSILDIPRMLFLLLFLILLVFLDLSDPDYFWHLKTGEWIVTHLALPETDPFSFTFAGAPWVLHEWLFQLVLYLVHDLLGDFGVKLMTALLVTLTLYTVFLAASQISRNRNLSALLVFVAFAPVASFIAPRPQLISYLLFSVTMLLLIRFKYFQQASHLLLLPLIMVLWVNMHGGYLIGIALPAMFLMTEYVSAWRSGGLDPERKRQLKRLAAISLVTGLCSALNPDFVRHWLYPFHVMSMEAARSLITEWRAPDFRTLSAQCYLLFAVVYFATHLYRRVKPDLTELLLPLLFFTAGFMAYRHMPFAVITAVPLLAAAISKPTGSAVSQGAIGRLYRKHIGGGAQLGSGEYVLNWAVSILVGVGLLLYAPVIDKAHTLERDATVPVQAADFVKRSGLNGRMFNTYQFGGYLIYRLYPEQQVFVDGRADMYGDEFLLEYMKIYSVASGWQRAFDKYAIDYVVCSKSAPIRQKLLSLGDFRLVHDDEYNSVLVRDIPRYAAIDSWPGR